MEHTTMSGPALAVALALAAGMVAQSIARHLRIPGIVLLLAAGVLLGPDVLGIVDSASLGAALPVLVGFGVAVILFEGGLNLRLSRLRTQVVVIPRLITVGALVTAIGGTLLAWRVMGWDLRISALFGALVVVTGPTVVTPLLRRIKVRHNVETILEAEGVLIDAVGAVLAVVTLDVVLSFSAASLAEGLGRLVGLLGFGLAFGAFGGGVIALLLRWRNVVPEGLENVLTLSLVVALFQVSNGLMTESGIMAVTAAGFVVGHTQAPALRDLMEFKEQLTPLFIGLLFVLLAAAVRVSDVLDLGWPGVLTVAGLMLVVRPLDVWISTAGSDLDWREKTFLSWLAPRGVVAAAVAALFAQSLDQAGIAGGSELRALVFLVIAATVVIQGSTGGPLASLLGLRRATRRGFVIVGANSIGRTLGRLLDAAGVAVVFVDKNPVEVRAAQEEGARVVYGNAIEERTLLRAEIDDRVGFVGLTPNEELNLLLAEKASREYRVAETYVALRNQQGSIQPPAVEARGARVLFGRPRDLDLWMVRLRRGLAEIERWERTEDEADDAEGLPEQLALPLVVRHDARARPFASSDRLAAGDVVEIALFSEQIDDAREFLLRNGWRPCPAPDEEREGEAHEHRAGAASSGT